MAPQLGRSDRGLGSDGDEGDRYLAPLRVGVPDDGALDNGRMTVQRAFDLDGGDVLAAGDDDVFQTISDLDISVRVSDGQVTGTQPPAGQHGRGRGGRVFVVAEHDVVSAQDQLPNGDSIGGGIRAAGGPHTPRCPRAVFDVPPWTWVWGTRVGPPRPTRRPPVYIKPAP